MKQSTRLISNTFTMITRMALTVGIGLVATRLLLQWLGKVDFGLMSALGATGTLLQSATMALTNSAQRHFAYEIGKGDEPKLIRVFNTAWVLLFAAAGLLWLIGQALAPLILNILKIPEDRLDASWWVYQVSLLSLLFAVAATPYRAMLVASQRLPVIAAQGVLASVLRFLAVLLLLVVPGDLLVAFVVMQMIGFAISQALITGICMWQIPASRPRLREFDRSEVGRIAHFAGWTAVNNLSMKMRMQGGMVLLAAYFGPAVNTAYTIATQVAMYMVNLANAMRLAIYPVIVGAEAKGNRPQVHRLTMVGGKYALLLLSFGFVPIWLEAELLLKVWLGDVPEFTLILVRLVVIWMMIHLFFMGYTLANQATGNIGWYVRIELVMAILILVLAAVAFSLGAAPWVLPVIATVIMLARMMIAVIYVGREIDLAPSRWFRESLLPTIWALVPATAAAALAHLTMSPGALRLAIVFLTYGAVSLPLTWWVGMALWERKQFRGAATTVLRRFRKRDPSESSQEITP